MTNGQVQASVYLYVRILFNDCLGSNLILKFDVSYQLVCFPHWICLKFVIQYMCKFKFNGFVYLYRALTEKIVAVLPKMKCPHRLEPHQIQGLDFIHIFPVVQVTDLF